MEYLIKTGSERVSQQCKENMYAVQTLKDFQYVDRDGKDQGVNVREKAKQLVALLRDEDRLREERAHALKTKEKLAQTATGESPEFACPLLAVPCPSLLVAEASHSLSAGQQGSSSKFRLSPACSLLVHLTRTKVCTGPSLCLGPPPWPRDASLSQWALELACVTCLSSNVSQCLLRAHVCPALSLGPGAARPMCCGPSERGYHPKEEEATGGAPHALWLGAAL